MTPAETSQLIHEKTDARLREIAAGVRGAIGLVALDLTSGERFSLNEHTIFPQASAIKIPILMEIYRQAGEGKFRLSDTRRIAKADMTPGTGVLSELGNGTVELSLHDLGVLMILVSDNTATNLLIDLAGIENVNRMLEHLGLQTTRLRRRMMDMAAASRGEENVSTPAEAARVMEILFRGEFISRAVCDEILAILLKPKPGAIRSALPEGIPVAFKPGGIGGVVTEWAIVMLKHRPYVVTVMENFCLGEEASGVIKEISKALYQHFARLSRATPHGVYVPRTTDTHQ